MEQTFSRISECIEDGKTKIYGVVVGKVLDVVDKLGLGRVRVQLPFIDDIDLSPWARVAVPMAGMSQAGVPYGTYFIPNPLQEVLVAFEHGEVNAPYIVGCLWNATSPPPARLPVSPIQTRMIKTPLGSHLTFEEVPPTITMETAVTGEKIEMTTGSIELSVGMSKITIALDGITIEAPKITINGTATVDVTSAKTSVSGTATAEFKSDLACVISGTPVKIN